MTSNAPLPPQRETPEEVAAYRAAIASATLRNIRLTLSKFNINPEGLAPTQPGWKQSYSCLTESTVYSPEKKIGTALIKANVTCKVDRRIAISLTCEYVVTYNIVGAPPEDAVNRFVGHVGRFAAFPYFRTLFSDLVGQAGINLPPLPVLKEGKRDIPVGTE